MNIVNDSIPKKKELLDAIITHTADSLIRYSAKTNTLTLLKNAQIIYSDIDLKAGAIDINSSNDLVYARGLENIEGVYEELPQFVQDGNESSQDSILLNMKTQKAKIWNLRTEQQGLVLRGAINKKYNDSIYYLKNIKITSSQKENPDYYINVRRGKFIKDKKLIIGLSNLVVADVPTPAFIPFGYVPLTKGSTSGIILPTWGDSYEKGYFLQNGGYYFAINDYVDLTVSGDVYTNGSWGTRTSSNYRKKYKFSGNFGFRYENNLSSIKGLPGFSKSSNYNIRWSHSQDSKSNPNAKLSASVNLGSSTYYRESYNEYNNNAHLNNTLSSSISFYKNFVNTPFKASINVNHSQNTNTKQISMTLPSFTLSMDRLNPFAPKSGVPKNSLQKMALNYSMRADNQITTTDEDFFKEKMFDDAKSGIQHTASLSTSARLLKHFTLSPSINYKEVWSFKRLEKSYDTTTQMAVNDTISGFNSFRTISTGASIGTTLYGNLNLKKGRITAIRHKVSPSISYSYSPDYSFYNEQVQQSEDPNDVIDYSPYSLGLYGAPSTGSSNTLNFSLRNTLEAKVKPRKEEGDDSEDEPKLKKITLLNNLTFSTGYNFNADTFKVSPIRMNGSTSLFKKEMQVNFSATLDPYLLNEEQKRVNSLLLKNGGFLRLTRGSLNLSYNLSNKKEKKSTSTKKSSDGIFGENLSVSNDISNSSEEETKKETTVYKATFPWSLSLRYQISYNNSIGQDEISNNSLMFNGDVEISPRWSLGFSSGYDFKGEGFTYTQLRFSRDLDSWKLNFNWIPFGARQTYYFFIGIKSSLLSDLKYDKRQHPDGRPY